MGSFLYLLCTLIIFITSLSLATTVNGKFTIVQMDSSNLSVIFQMNTNSGTDDLGGATIVFEFDSSSISFPENPIVNTDYFFHNFNGGNYSPATITKPMDNIIWVNIDLPFTNNNSGTVVAQSPGWTNVVTINFEIVDPNGTASLTWVSSSFFWGIYDANNSTLWQTGEFEDLFGPLPVELVSFTGILLPNDQVLLKWKTASSLNNYGFEIQKSYKNSDDWDVIGFVENNGDPNSLTEYTFIDNTLHHYPILEYRLKSIDKDGSFQFSDIIEVNTMPLNYELSQNYPNPFNPSTKIKFTIPYSATNQNVSVQLKVYDILGNEIATLVDEEKEFGIYEVEFTKTGLTSGVYIYQMHTADFVETRKMILLR